MHSLSSYRAVAELYLINEMSLITEAHRIVTAQETARLQAAAASSESVEGESESAEAESSE